MRKGLLLPTAAACILAFSQMGTTQGKETVVGTWKLLSASYLVGNQLVNGHPYGLQPTGLITYTGDGRVMVAVAFDGRKPLSVNDFITAPAEERAQAFATFFAYAGRYTFTGNKVVHHVEVASIQNWVNTDQVRLVTLRGDRLSLRTLSSSIGGVPHTAELVFERVK